MRRILGAAALLIGMLLAAYSLYGLHLYFAFTDMLSFLGPNQASPLPFALLLAPSVLFAGLGVGLFRSALPRS